MNRQFMKMYIPRRRRSCRSMYLQMSAVFCKYISGMFLLLAITLTGCRTPSETYEHRAENHISSQKNETQSGEANDTTTIVHHQADSTTTITKIIRRTIYENRLSTRSNSDSLKTEASRREDTLTPELIKAVFKGFAVACIGVGLMVLGFLVLVIILLFKLKQ